jgi:hypothetical protein
MIQRKTGTTRPAPRPKSLRWSDECAAHFVAEGYRKMQAIWHIAA